MLLRSQTQKKASKHKSTGKKCKFSLLLIFLSLFLNVTIAVSQIDINKYHNSVPPNISSFEKYGNIPVNYSTGQVSQNINLYTLDIDDNIKIPLDLTYSNTGMKPDEIPSWVGHGWDLMPGGYILQEIRGKDDLLPGGLRYDLRQRTELENYLNGVTIDPVERYFYIKNALAGHIDTQQDVFSLNFLGKSTKFYFDGTTVKFIKQEPYQIELLSQIGFIVTDEKGYKFYFLNSLSNSGTAVSDLNGGEVTGGTRTWNLDKIVTPQNEVVNFQYKSDAIYTIKNVDVSYTYGPSDIIHRGDNDYVCYASFKGPSFSESNTTVAQAILHSISYKGRTVNFGTIPRNDISTIYGSKANALASIQVLNEKNESIKLIQFTYDNNLRLRLDQVSILDNITNLPVLRYGFEYYGKLTDIPLITSEKRDYGIDHWGYYNAAGGSPLSVSNIDYSKLIPGLTSQFGKNNNSTNSLASLTGMLHRIFYPTGGYTEIEYEPNKMIYSTIVNDIYPYLSIDRPLETTVLFSSTNCAKGDAGGTGGGGYETGYFTLTEDVDKMRIDWQFVNSNGVNSSFRIDRIVNGNVVQAVVETVGSNNGNTAYQSFPAGEYKYTLNASCDEGTTANSVVLQLHTSKVPPGGAIATVGGNRVFKIKDFDNLGGITNIRKFLYTNAELNQMPKYIDTYEVVAEPLIDSYLPDLTCGPVYNIGNRNITPKLGFHITYGQATEMVGENGENGKNVYSYGRPTIIATNYLSNPYPPAIQLNWRDNDLQRMESYERKGSDFIKKKSTSYIYTPTPLPPTQVPESIKGMAFGIKGIVVLGNENREHYTRYFNTAGVALPTDRYGLAAQVDTTFNNDGTIIVDKTNRNYNANDFLLSSVSKTSSSGQSIENKIWYPNDFNDNAANVAVLKANNMVGLPLKTIVSKNGNVISGEVNRRNDKGDIIENYIYENIDRNNSILHDPLVYYPPFFELKNSLFYNNKLREIKQKDGTSTAILWSYSNTYPLAEVKNATYQQVLDVLGQPAIDQLNSSNLGSETEVNAILATLRTDSRLKDASVSTYKYKPLVGMVSQTDSKGSTIYYQYDGLERLQYIKDKDKNIIKSYNYNYAQTATLYRNDPYYTYFIKDDCISGSGSSVVFGVPFGTYSSTISVEDANAKALAYVNASGQAYANANGICAQEPVLYNMQRSQVFTKNCVIGKGSQVTYMVPEGKYSGVSLEAANAKADAEIATEGQNYANANGTCSITKYYARVEIENVTANVYGNFKESRADIYIRFYTDAACTLPYTLTNEAIITMNDLSLFGQYADPENNAYLYNVSPGSFQYNLGNIHVRGEVLYADPNGEEAGYSHVYSISPPSDAGYFGAATIGANY